ncbi:MAG TPA: hypothetical protein VNH15_05965 [Elusimicrobiota bacterium]|nr:hypothetical protein [Elusimicrobiota bacterium]
MGQTLPDGHIAIIDPLAFQSPGFLASIIVHERTHYEQTITLGQGDKIHMIEAEKEAFSNQLGAAKILGLTNDQIKKLQTDETNEVQGLKNIGNPGFWTLPDANAKLARHIEDIKKEGRDDFLSSVAQGSGNLDRKFNTAKKERVADHARQAAEDAAQARRKSMGWVALEKYAGTVCDYDYPGPNAMQDRQYLLTHSIVIQKSEIKKLLDTEGASELDGCEDAFVLRVYKANGTINSAWLVQEIDEDNAEGVYGHIFHPILKGLKFVGAVLVAGFAVPFIAVGATVVAVRNAVNAPDDSGNGSQGAGTRASRPSTPDSGIHLQNSEAYGQLEGIADGTFNGFGQ